MPGQRLWIGSSVWMTFHSTDLFQGPSLVSRACLSPVLIAASPVFNLLRASAASSSTRAAATATTTATTTTAPSVPSRDRSRRRRKRTMPIRSAEAAKFLPIVSSPSSQVRFLPLETDIEAESEVVVIEQHASVLCRFERLCLQSLGFSPPLTVHPAHARQSREREVVGRHQEVHQDTVTTGTASATRGGGRSCQQ